MAVNHVILRNTTSTLVPYFVDYVKRYTDLPFLVELERDGNGYKMGGCFAQGIARYKDMENNDWKLVLDATTGEPPKDRLIAGSVHGKRNRPARTPWTTASSTGAELHRGTMPLFRSHHRFWPAGAHFARRTCGASPLTTAK